MTVRVDVVVMAHPRREAYIPELLASLDRPAQVVWDQRNDRWHTGRRAWQAVDQSSASHGLVLQDDAIVCRDLVAGVERALTYVPPDTPLCLYCGRVRPYRYLVQQLVERAADASWLTMATLNWGPGIVLPGKWIDEMVEWGDSRPDVANYDKRISRWLGHRGVSTYYPWPSLVDHRVGPSLVPGRTGDRRAHRFIGAERSALDCDWTGATVSIPALSQADRYRPHRPPPAARVPRIRKPKLGVAVKFVSPKYPQLQVHRARVRFRDGVAEVRDPDAVAELMKPTYRQMGVVPVEEPAAEPQQQEQQEPAADVAPAVEREPGVDAELADNEDEDGDEDGDAADEAPADAADDGQVPDGGAKQILAWIGDDPDRARRALEAEQARDKPRSTLVATLTKLAG